MVLQDCDDIGVATASPTPLPPLHSDLSAAMTPLDDTQYTARYCMPPPHDLEHGDHCDVDHANVSA